MSKSFCTLLTGILFSLLTGCNGHSENKQPSQDTSGTKLVGGGCDGCELMYVGIPTIISPVDTSAGWLEQGQKLIIAGNIYSRDGKTPAPGVIIYYWHTDHKGYYSPKPEMEEKAKRHGHLRGWVKSDENGKFTIYTIRPVPYPNENIPAHIHFSIKEPTIRNEYYTDDIVFADDPLLTIEKRSLLENRGGSGIVDVTQEGDIQMAVHRIILGLNIPNHPSQGKTD